MTHLIEPDSQIPPISPEQGRISSVIATLPKLEEETQDLRYMISLIWSAVSVWTSYVLFCFQMARGSDGYIGGVLPL